MAARRTRGLHPALHTAVLALATAAFWPPRSAAADFGQEAKVVGSMTGSARLFGRSVSVSGNTMVVGAPYYDYPGQTGSAYVFVRSGAAWPQQQRLTASDGAAYDRFGESVLVSGDVILIGAPGTPARGATPGAVYVFTRSGSTWTEQHKLTASDGLVGDLFGESVALSGDMIVVGAIDVRPAARYRGAAYVFVREGSAWSEQQKLMESGLSAEHLGQSIAVSGDTMVVGMLYDYGEVYVYQRTGSVWTLQQTLTRPPGASYFGYSLSLSGDTLAVGARFAAYVFVRSGATWTQQQQLPSPGDPWYFGWAVALSGETLVVGATGRRYEDETLPAQRGAAYVFERSGTVWTQRQQFTGSDVVEDALFGFAVALSGDTIVAGAIYDDVSGAADAGAAYVFRTGAGYFPLTPCRVVDTRTTGPALAANDTRTVVVAGACQVPADARAVAANLIAVNPGAVGYLRLNPTGAAAPLVSTLNFAPNRTRANNAAVSLGMGGQVDVGCVMSPGSPASTHFVLDVFGYYR